MNCDRMAVIGLGVAVFGSLIANVPSSSPPSPGNQHFPRCPPDTYQSAPVVFVCQAATSRTRVLLEKFREKVEFGVPKGTINFTLSMSSLQFDGDLAIYDPVAGVWIKDHLTQQPRGTWRGTYKGMHVTVISPFGKPTGEKFFFSGPLPTVLTIRLQSYEMDGGEFALEYSYGRNTDCIPDSLPGCRKYDAIAAMETVAQWSKWIRSIHPTMEEAWQEIAGRYAEHGMVPWHRWCNVWNQWSAASPHMPADCKAVYKFITHGGLEKGIENVDKTSFTFAYELDSILKFNARCSSMGRAGYQDETSAWNSFKKSQKGTFGANSYVGIADAIWAICSSWVKSGTTKQQWMQLTDVNGAPGMQEDEFHGWWTSSLQCPRYDYYRTQPLLFGCQPQMGHTTILLPQGVHLVSDIPAELQDLEIRVEVAGGNIGIALKDIQSNSYALKAEQTGRGCSNTKLNCTVHGARLYWSGNVPAKIGKASFGSFTFKDPTPTPLALEVSSGLSTTTPAKVTYNYTGYTDCPNQPDSDELDVPFGCSYLDNRKAPRQACVDFSRFLQLKHLDAVSLLATLDQANGLEATAVGTGIPFHMWSSVWADWPGKTAAGEVWQECFHWCDVDRNGIIAQTELEQCFLLGRTHDVVESFCTRLCKTFPNEAALWATWTDGAEAVAAGRWKTLWDRDNEVSKKSIAAAYSFRYMDKDGNQEISKDEYSSCYSKGKCGHAWPLIGGILGGAGAAASAASTAAWRLKHSVSSTSSPIDAHQGVGNQATPVPDRLRMTMFSTPRPASSASSSSTSLVWWLWPIFFAIILCCCTICALAIAPLIPRRKRHSTVSSIGEESTADLEHEQVYSNLNHLDSLEADPLANPSMSEARGTSHDDVAWNENLLFSEPGSNSDERGFGVPSSSMRMPVVAEPPPPQSPLQPPPVNAFVPYPQYGE